MSNKPRQPIPKRVRYEVLRRDGHKCRYCGATAADTKLTIDHVIPDVLGGTNDPNNLVAACADCNAGKTSTTPDGPLVAAVADDALRWAQAMKQASDEIGGRDADMQKMLSRIKRRWSRNAGNVRALPGDWAAQMVFFHKAGLPEDDILAMVDAAFHKDYVKDRWPYFYGCCKRRLESVQDRARELVTENTTTNQSLLISTAWTREQIDRRIDAAIRAMQADDWAPGFTKNDLGQACGHGIGCQDDLCHLTQAAGLAMYIRVTDGHEADQVLKESALMDELDRLDAAECDAYELVEA